MKVSVTAEPTARYSILKPWELHEKHYGLKLDSAGLTIITFKSFREVDSFTIPMAKLRELAGSSEALSVLQF